MLSYFDGKITGNEIFGFLNQEVRDDVRVGKLKLPNLPFTYIEGRRVYKKGYKRIGPSTLQALTEKEREEVRFQYVSSGLTIYQLAPMHGVSHSTVFKTIRGLKRGSGKVCSG
jgi:DNA-binding CsgD family transcriptional regulator